MTNTYCISSLIVCNAWVLRLQETPAIRTIKPITKNCPNINIYVSINLQVNNMQRRPKSPCFCCSEGTRWLPTCLTKPWLGCTEGNCNKRRAGQLLQLYATGGFLSELILSWILRDEKDKIGDRGDRTIRGVGWNSRLWAQNMQIHQSITCLVWGLGTLKPIHEGFWADGKSLKFIVKILNNFW